MAELATAEELIDAEFLNSLQRLRLVARRVPRGGRFAEQRSAAQGAGIEFQDYRPYSTGDDLRAIDWNIYRRLGRVFLRLFEEMEDLPVYLLPDHSQSMWLEQPPRIRPCLRATMALTAIALGQHDRVGIFPFSSEMKVLVRPRTGFATLPSFAARLQTLSPGGQTDFGQSLSRFSGLRLRRGLAVVVSDFFDPGGLPAVLEALKRIPHHLLLVQLVRPSDSSPDLQGDLRLRDCETGESQDITVDAAVLKRYQNAYREFQNGLTSFAQKRNFGLLRLNAEQEVVPQLASLFENGRLEI
ncbi:MAG: DUF58 domain-containing protein [Planctomycetes bacterium]|nr:DUF58 domain-containing protein [Planctomycetota bacterium]